MDLIQIILLLGFTIIGFTWRATDPRNFVERWNDFFEKQIPYTLTAYSVLIVSLFWYRFFKWPETKVDIVFIIFGVVLFFAGIYICIWAKLVMKKNWGIPSQLNIKRQRKLIREGPFKFSRNPMYLGFIVLLLGYSIALRSMLLPLIVGLAIWYFTRAVKKEEKLLEKNFGSTYKDYKRRVPRFL
jgi:protein-S-isoprenylcysteine O-methyltransferase Ste14